MLTANDERQKKGILLLLYSPMLCILAFSLSLALDELNCHLFHVSAQRIFLFLVLGAFHKKQTRNVHQQHQKLFNIKMNVYEEKRVKQRLREEKV
jgi:hypothetical protein